ncbi:MAG: hypothetical protein KDC75_18655 [Phaeodactylibacter sp.]|nr:hypothetical protein [Phaeodactylibacter sp.]
MKLSLWPVWLFIGIGSCCFFQCSQPEPAKQPPGAIPADWFFRQRAYPDGQVDQAKYLQAVRRQKRLEAGGAQRSMTASWIFRGPLNTGGRISALAVHPDFPDTLFVGAASGGVFRSYDRGDSFVPVFDDALSLSIGDIDIAPSNPSVIYVGTGEANAGGGTLAYDGVGVYKSTDGGSTWQPAGLPASGSTGRVAVHPTDPDRVYVAAMGRLFGNNPERGIYRTTDGGQHWEQVLYLNDSTGGIDLALHPTQPDTLYAAMWERTRGPGFYYYGGYSSGIYRSHDGGDTWEHLTNGLPNAEMGRIGLALSPANPEVIYAQIIDPLGALIDVYRSNDGGENWFPTGTAGINAPPYMWWFGRLFPHPHDPETVFLPSVNLHRTTNGGQYWNGVASFIHVDHHDLYIDPHHPDYIVLGNDGGLYISEDNAQSWQHKKSLPITQFYTCEVDYSNPSRRYGGTQDNGTIRTTSGNVNDWKLILFRDGFYCLVDPTDNSYVYAESQSGTLRRSINGGLTFLNALSGIPDEERRNWSTPFVFNPLNPRSLYYGTSRLYKTTNRAVSWTAISENLTGPEDPGNLVYGTITSIAVSPVDTNHIFVGADNGRAWKTADGGQNWQLLSADLPNRWVTRVAACPVNTQVAYITFSGYRSNEYLPHVFKTLDGGQNWVDISGGLPEVPVNEIIVNPDAPNELYLSNDVGVFVSYNAGNTWANLGQGLPTVVVADLALHVPSQELYAATYGRSMYSLPLSQIPGPAQPISGTVRREDGEPVPGAAAYLDGQDNFPILTDTLGVYRMDGLAAQQDYSIGMDRDGDNLNGVSTFDLLLINKHILGVELLDSPYKRLAADVNNTQSITTLDMIILRRLILGLDIGFPSQPSWRFVPASYIFPEPENPWAEDFPEQIPIQGLPVSGLSGRDFIGIKIGDVNLDAIP